MMMRLYISPQNQGKEAFLLACLPAGPSKCHQIGLYTETDSLVFDLGQPVKILSNVCLASCQAEI
jgi:hypothetical protein